MGAFFLASNGLLYRNPLIRGDGWLIVFDGEDEPELVIAKANGETVLDATQARLRAVSIIDQSGLAAMISGPPRQMIRAYDPEGREVRNSFCFWLDVEEPIPAELIPEPARAGGVAEPPGDAVVYSYGQPWGDT